MESAVMDAETLELEQIMSRYVLVFECSLKVGPTMDSFVRHTRTKGYDDNSISVGVTLGVLLSVVSDLLTVNTTTSCLLNEVPNIIGKIL